MKDLLQHFRKQPLFIIIGHFVDNPGQDFSKADIARATGLSRATVFNRWHLLESPGIVKVTRKFGKTRLYQLDHSNEVLKKILELEGLLIKKVVGKT